MTAEPGGRPGAAGAARSDRDTTRGGSGPAGAWAATLAWAAAIVRRLGGDRRGSIAILAAVGLTSLSLASAMAVDLARVYLAQANTQRAADQSALAAAFGYMQGGSQAAALSAAQSLATTNGVANATTTVTASYVANFANGNPAEQVTISYPVTLSPFAAIAGLHTVTVSVSAWAEMGGVIPCILTVNNDGIYTTGNASMTATGCAIESSSVIDWALDQTGGTVTAAKITAAGAITNYGSTTINGPQTAHTSGPTDPYAGIATSLFATISSVRALSPPAAPAIGTAPSGGSASTCTAANNSAANAKVYGFGTTYGQIGPPSTSCYISFSGGSGATAYISSLSNCNGSNTAAICLTGSATLNISLGAGTYNIAGLYAAGGTLAITLTGNPTINIWNGITATGNGTITIDGAATFNVLGGITNASSNEMRFCVTSCTAIQTLNVDGGISIPNGGAKFANGNVNVSSGDGSGKTGAGFDIGSVTVSFGDGNFNVARGINLAGGGDLIFGHTNLGCSNFYIPSVASTGASAGYAIYTGGGTDLIFAYPCTTNAFNGTVAVQGNWLMNPNAGSASTWTIAGALEIGGPPNGGNCGSGGSIWTGSLVQIVASGEVCVGAGYSDVSLSSPTAITTATVGTAATVAIASSQSGANAYVTDGSNITLTGAFYIPSEPLYLLGSGTITGNGGCLIVDVGAISAQNGSSIVTDCTGVASLSTVTLAQ